ncbi:hypothetical protein [Caulobacter sp. NIBR1757]|uniref:hypothetical protein n=1 Tax=Caulobacter sp. NIBR1757 TaxID=3016000 RepID=UPI0022EFFABD|nr:hypothetical protein [Caulobacter sp. NIBR1757]WGM37270.1 hypothetical protein AMEJIAPC_00165 [Caulobacter sp. NIBR1757]
MGQQPPARMLIRSYADMTLRYGQVERAAFDGDPLDAFIFKTLFSANCRHLPYASAESRLLALTGPPAAAAMAERRALLRPVSIHAVSQSLNLPYETVRARTRAMMERGQVERVRGGLLAVAALQAEGPLAEAMLATHAIILDSFRALKALGFDVSAHGLPAQVAEPPPPGLVVRIVADMSNRYAELLSPTFGGILPLTIWGGAMRANVRDLMADPETAWRYACQDEPPPDHLRKPISVRALSAELGLPFETTRRHVAAMIDRGWLAAVPGQGVITPVSALGADSLGHTNLQLPGLYARMFCDLARAGFDLGAL